MRQLWGNGRRGRSNNHRRCGFSWPRHRQSSGWLFRTLFPSETAPLNFLCIKLQNRMMYLYILFYIILFYCSNNFTNIFVFSLFLWNY
ncbi:hypothetical protein AGR6A_Cc80014 [Agrobacterium sp. NCPPB 925]|nr:hypothetical protein AGR6A_Cc80014 [Agrobacterium sp. NCPPB 925]